MVSDRASVLDDPHCGQSKAMLSVCFAVSQDDTVCLDGSTDETRPGELSSYVKRAETRDIRPSGSFAASGIFFHSTRFIVRFIQGLRFTKIAGAKPG